MSKSKHVHTSHQSIINRLMRVNGHILSVVEMIREEKECIDVSQQLHAITKAVISAKQAYINDHIEHCLEPNSSSTPKQINESIKDLKVITKYLTN